jgi:hypothetical protein
MAQVLDNAIVECDRRNADDLDTLSREAVCFGGGSELNAYPHC